MGALATLLKLYGASATALDRSSWIKKGFAYYYSAQHLHPDSDV